MAEKDEEDADDQEGGAHDAPSEEILRHFPRRGPPSAAELHAFKRRFPPIYKAFAPLVSLKIGGRDIGPESKRQLHQDAFTRFWALVLQYGVPANLGEALGAIAWGMRRNYLRRRERAGAYARATLAEAMGTGWLAEPSAHFRLLLNEAVTLLAPGDADLLRWVGVEGHSYDQIAAWLGVPRGTVCSRLHDARERLLAILNPLRDKGRTR
jgi:DNA-directed RNA polymerase specialized sigma24 family protein